MAPAQSDFVPRTLDASRWEVIEPYLEKLAQRPVNSVPELERWLLDRSELDAACGEARAELYIRLCCDTDNAEVSAAYSRYLEGVPPRLKPRAFALDQRLVELEARHALPADRYGVLLRSKRNGVELFREENIPLQTEDARLVQEFDRLAGAQTVEFDGREQTLPQMARYLELPDRAKREAAWRAIHERRLRDRDALNDIYDRMIALRQRMARQAGMRSYVEYSFKERERFDYTPRECAAFWEAVESQVVPLVRRLDAQRARVMGLASLRPWDLHVDPRGRPPLRPFEGGRELVARTRGIIARLDGRLVALFDRLLEGGDAGTGDGMRTECLDLDSRKGKRPGGFQYMRDRARRPFIFMNAAGLQRDVMTMLHEAGHAFHSLLCAGEPLLDYRHSPTEFAEVASMAMEHLTLPHWGAPVPGAADGFYEGAEELARARRTHLEDSISILPWIAAIDALQHWVYRQPAHTRAQREEQWLELDARFGHALAWDGLEELHRSAWQRQSHLFGHPLYYIEYGIAQLGALQLWLKSTVEGERSAVDAYIAALRLGGSRPLPELFEAAGLSFDFGTDTVRRVVGAVEKELDKLPA